uniref:Uncharacterized protein n=1 Tax=Setaria viridis TaxID=4556 RepID=A0A4U6U1K6_SETVI|nr:hypothetical protein SEVIR_7G339433v2 [Setaria viridis]
MLPRRWIMLDNAHAGSRCHRFLNTSTGECIRTDLPELAGHAAHMPAHRPPAGDWSTESQGLSSSASRH